MIEPGTHELRALDPRAITLWRLTSLGNGAFFLAFAVAAELIFDIPAPTGLVPAAVAILVGAVAMALPPIRYRRWQYLIRDDHVYLRHGVVFRTTSIVPHARIQHVDTRNGPLDRWLGLASLVVYTAGTRGAIVTIPALETGLAEDLRDHLAALSGAGDAV